VPRNTDDVNYGNYGNTNNIQDCNTQGVNYGTYDIPCINTPPDTIDSLINYVEYNGVKCID
jgi:hypothetical protein